MKTVNCLSCNFVNSGVTTESACSQCGESLAPALFQQSVDELKKLTSTLPRAQAPTPSFYSFNGFGTMLLDYRQLTDGTYEAVRWVTILRLPIVPLSAYVIEPLGQEISYGRETSKFRILGRSSLSVSRIVRTYLLAVIGLAPIILGFIYSTEINRTFSGVKAFGLMLLAFAWAVYIVLIKIPNEGKAYKGLAAS